MGEENTRPGTRCLLSCQGWIMVILSRCRCRAIRLDGGGSTDRKRMVGGHNRAARKIFLPTKLQ